MPRWCAGIAPSLVGPPNRISSGTPLTASSSDSVVRPAKALWALERGAISSTPFLLATVGAASAPPPLSSVALPAAASAAVAVVVVLELETSAPVPQPRLAPADARPTRGGDGERGVAVAVPSLPLFAPLSSSPNKSHSAQFRSKKASLSALGALRASSGTRAGFKKPLAVAKTKVFDKGRRTLAMLSRLGGCSSGEPTAGRVVGLPSVGEEDEGAAAEEGRDDAALGNDGVAPFATPNPLPAAPPT